ncbi:MAG TPA: antibiotic biosynthesis monooxygenase [Gemmatimonadales bacterium]|nr:antibiotic biosynthesis monooxygenase [Gemmatimonadales bacterium]
MFIVLWMFEAKAGAEEDFARAYGPAGDWARLFGRSPEYIATELVRDLEIARRFLTIERWRSRHGFEQFRAGAKHECEALDARCKELTRNERLIGHFEAPPAAPPSLPLEGRGPVE